MRIASTLSIGLALLTMGCKFQRKAPEQTDVKTVDIEMTEIKHQGSIGICWAYAAMAKLEEIALRKTGQKVDLSEAFLFRAHFSESQLRQLRKAVNSSASRPRTKTEFAALVDKELQTGSNFVNFKVGTMMVDFSENNFFGTLWRGGIVPQWYYDADLTAERTFGEFKGQLADALLADKGNNGDNFEMTDRLFAEYESGKFKQYKAISNEFALVSTYFSTDSEFVPDEKYREAAYHDRNLESWTDPTTGPATFKRPDKFMVEEVRELTSKRNLFISLNQRLASVNGVSLEVAMDEVLAAVFESLRNSESVLMGFPLLKSLERIDGRAVFVEPEPKQELLGGHGVLLVDYVNVGGRPGRASPSDGDRSRDSLANLEYLVIKNSWGYDPRSAYPDGQKRLTYKLRNPGLPAGLDILTSGYVNALVKNQTWAQNGHWSFMIPANGLSETTRKKVRKYDSRCSTAAQNPKVTFKGAIQKLCYD